MSHLSTNEANQLTRESIRIALIHLMNHKRLNQITISELTRCAGVSRQSFYRNYASKEAVIAEIEEQILSAFTESLNPTKYKENIKLWLRDMFDLLVQNKSIIRTLYRADLMNSLISDAPFLIEEHVRHPSSQTHYYILGCLSAIRGIASDWFLNGMTESPDAMADLCMYLLPPALLSAFDI